MLEKRSIRKFWLISLILLFAPAYGCKEFPKELDPPDIDITHTPEEPTPEPETNPVCTQIMSAADGANGFLWKPESDSGGKLVVLLPSKFIVPFEGVIVETKEGATEFLNFTGFSNGDRQTWRGIMPGIKYRDNGIISAQEFKQTCNWQLPGRAGRRHD